MIGGRALLICLVIITGLTLAFGLRPADRLLADPPGATRAVELVRTRAAEAMDALVRLRTAIEPALDGGRRGAARIVAGDDPPGPELSAAAAMLDAASGLGTELRDRLDALAGAATAAQMAVTVPTPTTGAEVTSIADQLAETAEAADEFARMRQTALGSIEAVGDALEAIDDEDLDAADRALATAGAGLSRIEAWDVDFATLPVWIEVTGEVIGSLQALTAATRAGDVDAASAAAARFAEIADRAREADLGLRIALDEGGAAVAAAPLGRMVELLRRLLATEQALAPLMLGPDR